MYIFENHYTEFTVWTWVRSIHAGGVGLGRVGSICVGLCGSRQVNFTLSVIVKFTQFSELLVLLKLFSV